MERQYDDAILICLPKFLRGHKKFLGGGWGEGGVSEFFTMNPNLYKKNWRGGGREGGVGG